MGGCWSAQEEELLTNCLKMLAAFYEIRAFIKNHQGMSVLLHAYRQHSSDLCLPNEGDKVSVAHFPGD